MKGSLYERYGNNEPYTDPDPESVHFEYALEPLTFFQLMTGPSTNFYVGLEEVHYTIPKRLLYQFSAFAKPCLEGRFAEAEVNSVWLPDVRPDVFQWIWRWLYQGKLQAEKNCYWMHDGGQDTCYEWHKPRHRQLVCQLLCRVHMLGERLLFDRRFLEKTVQAELEALIEEAKEDGDPNPFTPEIIEDILSQSAPVDSFSTWWNLSLRSFLFEKLCDYDVCANMDLMKCSKCFELDGAFAAELMGYMAGELLWAVELWGAQTESIVDVAEKELQLAGEEGRSQWLVKKPKRRSYVWLALRYMCTFQGCTTAKFREYIDCFELDGAFAAEILAYMAGELRWVREKWGEERGPSVDVAQEKEEEDRNAREEDDITRLVNRNRYR